jgi:hypothetical protein
MEQAKRLAERGPTEADFLKLTPRQLGLSSLQQQLVDRFQTPQDVFTDDLTQAGQQLDTAGQTLVDAGTAGGLATGIFDPSMTQQFMNPYQKAVTEQALAQLNKQFMEQSAQRGAGAVGAGAFGGSRQGVLEGIAQRELGEVASRRIFEDLARNFGQAQQGAMTAFENQQRRQAGQAGLLANIGQAQSQQALQRAGLGELAQNLQLKDLQALQTVGGLEQAQRQADEQARLAGERFQFLEPQQRLSFFSDILRGVPSTQIQTLTGPPQQQQVPLFQQALGAGITGLGLYGAGSKLGIF